MLKQCVVEKSQRARSLNERVKRAKLELFSII